MSVSPRQFALRLVVLQALTATVVAGVWAMTGWVAGVSALLGGLATILPSLYFAIRFFAATQARQVDRIIKAFYWGELTKLVLSAALVIALFQLWPGMAELPFFCGFISACLGFWLAPCVIRNKK